jgi:uncharacterized protein YndB with AHSA1/START domain
MAKANESVWLNTRPEEVWPSIAEPEKRLQWLTETHEHEWLTEGSVGAGSRYYVQKEVKGQVRRYDCMIERWEENHCFAFTCEAPGFSRLQAEWELTPEGGGCRFTMQEEINVQKANWLMDRLFVQPNAAWAVRGFLAQLKRLVESRTRQ